jgi:hypothetical protein
MFQVLALGHKAGQSGDGDRIAAMLVGFEKGVYWWTRVLPFFMTLTISSNELR